MEPSASLQLIDGTTIRRMGFGAMRITGAGIWGDPPDPAAARGLLRRVVELGVQLIDTADAYGPGTSEQLIGEALAPYSAGVVIATKGGLVRPADRSWQRDARPEHLREACEASLRRLRVECIDLYQLHAPDEKVRFADSVGELARLREAGKVRMVGLSNVGVAQLAEARTIVPIASVQNRYSLADRTHEAVVDACEQAGIAFLPWYPLAAGEFARSGGELGAVARELGATPVQVALAWLMHRSPVMCPIPGTSRIVHFELNLAAERLRLDADQLRRLETRGARSPG
jgi:aryl-alcohol dehydrogenase-like predicted oxidoreductase